MEGVYTCTHIFTFLFVVFLSVTGCLVCSFSRRLVATSPITDISTDVDRWGNRGALKLGTFAIGLFAVVFFICHQFLLCHCFFFLWCCHVTHRCEPAILLGFSLKCFRYQRFLFSFIFRHAMPCCFGLVRTVIMTMIYKKKKKKNQIKSHHITSTWFPVATLLCRFRQEAKHHKRDGSLWMHDKS